MIWLNFTSPAEGFAPWEHYGYHPFGLALLFAEIFVFGLAPAALLIHGRWRMTGAALACCGILLNRFVLTIQTLALPTLSLGICRPSRQGLLYIADRLHEPILIGLMVRYRPFGGTDDAAL